MKEVITGIVIGVCSAGSTAFIVWIYTVVRDLRLRSKIKKIFQVPGMFESIDGLGVVLNNKLHIPLIIRNVAVRLSATKGHPQRPDGGEYGTFKLNYCSPYICAPQTGLKLHDENRGFTKLPPYTEGSWIILRKALNDKYLEFTEFMGIEITVEYLTLLKIPKILIIEDKKPSSAAYFLNNLRKRYTEK
jgi:hypothetical protein